MTIHHVYGKSNIVSDALLCCPDFAAIVGAAESALLTKICDAYAVAHGDSWEWLMQTGNAC